MRLPLAIPNDSREAARTQDTWAVNCFVEKDDELRLVKRPGLISAVDVTGVNIVGQGLFIWPSADGPKVIALWDDILWVYEDVPPPYSSAESGWDFGDPSTASGSAVSIPEEPGPGWEIISVALPVPIGNGVGIYPGTSIFIRDADYQDSYSWNGSAWSAATPWSGPAYSTSVNGFYSGGYVWGVIGYDGTLYLLRDAYSAQSIVSIKPAPSGFSTGSFKDLYAYVLGPHIYVQQYIPETPLLFARSLLTGGDWTLITSNLTATDRYNIVIMGSTAYALPRGHLLGKNVYSSTDFITWTLLTSDWGMGTNYVSVIARHAYSGKIVALLDTDDIAVSSDGVTWTKSNYSPHVLPTNFLPLALLQFDSDWYAAGGTEWAKLLAARVP